MWVEYPEIRKSYPRFIFSNKFIIEAGIYYPPHLRFFKRSKHITFRRNPSTMWCEPIALHRRPFRRKIRHSRLNFPRNWSLCRLSEYPMHPMSNLLLDLWRKHVSGKKRIGFDSAQLTFIESTETRTNFWIFLHFSGSLDVITPNGILHHNLRSFMFTRIAAV